MSNIECQTKIRDFIYDRLKIFSRFGKILKVTISSTRDLKSDTICVNWRRATQTGPEIPHSTNTRFVLLKRD
jgi:hypothetical protein